MPGRGQLSEKRQSIHGYLRVSPAIEAMVTTPNDFTVRMPWGYCGNKIWNDSRKAEISVLFAERLAAVEFLNGGKSPVAGGEYAIPQISD